MKALVITPKNNNEYTFLWGLLKKLGIYAKGISIEELEDIGLSKLMKDVDRTRKVSKETIMKKLNS
jgi:reverse gyrase